MKESKHMSSTTSETASPSTATKSQQQSQTSQWRLRNREEWNVKFMSLWVGKKNRTGLVRQDNLAKTSIRYLLKEIPNENENWGHQDYALRSYLDHTFRCVADQNKVLTFVDADDKCQVALWNTGLLSQNTNLLYCIMVRRIDKQPISTKTNGSTATNGGGGSSSYPQKGVQVENDDGDDDDIVFVDDDDDDDQQQQQQQQVQYPQESTTEKWIVKSFSEMNALYHKQKMNRILGKKWLNSKKAKDFVCLREDLDELPSRADYFKDALLDQVVFNPSVKVSEKMDFSHLVHRKKRLPASLQSKGPQDLSDTVKVGLRHMVNRAVANYRIGVPCYFTDKKAERGTLCLLMPLRFNTFGSKYEECAVALKLDVPGKDGYMGIHNVYRIKTILTREMAYENARLLARIDQDWLLQKQYMPPYHSHQSTYSLAPVHHTSNDNKNANQQLSSTKGQNGAPSTYKPSIQHKKLQSNDKGKGKGKYDL